MKPVLWVSLLLVSTAVADGQALSRMIVGTVAGQTAVVGPKAEVTLSNVGAHFAHTVETNEAR